MIVACALYQAGVRKSDPSTVVDVADLAKQGLGFVRRFDLWSFPVVTVASLDLLWDGCVILPGIRPLNLRSKGFSQGYDGR